MISNLVSAKCLGISTAQCLVSLLGLRMVDWLLEQLLSVATRVNDIRLTKQPNRSLCVAECTFRGTGVGFVESCR